MPVDNLRFRTSCGSFFGIFLQFMEKRRKKKAAMYMRTVTVRRRTTGAIIGLLLVFLFYGDLLYLAGDVETNPGPKGMRQTRLTSSGRSISVSPSDKSEDIRAASSGNSVDIPGEPSMKVVIDMLSVLTNKVDNVKAEVSEVKSIYGDLKDEFIGMQKEISDLKKENDFLKADNAELKKKIDEVEQRTDDLENRSKRNNLLFYGIPREDQEKSTDCETILKDILKDKLKLTSSVTFDRVHRLSDKKNSPVIARCTFYSDKVMILKEKGKLKGCNLFIGEDFSRKVQGIRKRLIPHLKKAKAEGKRSTMVFDHLVIDSVKYGIGVNDNLVKLK